MTLYEISENYLMLLDNLTVDEETGEVLNADELDIIAGEFEDKAENYGLYIKNLTSMSEAINTEKKKLSDRQKAIDRKTEILTDRLAWAMQSVSRTKFETGRVAMSFRKFPPHVNIVDEKKLPEKFLRTTTTVEPDKIAIKKELAEGNEVDGATLEYRQSLHIK